MRQFMGEKLAALIAVGRISFRAEDDVAPDRVGKRVDGPRGVRSSGVCVNSHVAELLSKARLHLTQRRAINRRAG